MTVMYYCYRML